MWRVLHPVGLKLSASLVLVSLLLAGCAGVATSPPTRNSSTTNSSTVSITGGTSEAGSTTTTPGAPTTSAVSPRETRIGVMIPASIIYEGRVYSGSGREVARGKSTPSNLSPIGSAFAADEKGAPITSGTYDVYAIQGADRRDVIAVRFTATSPDGPTFAWLEYSANE